jgi:hypothetical protein
MDPASEVRRTILALGHRALYWTLDDFSGRYRDAVQSDMERTVHGPQRCW